MKTAKKNKRRKGGWLLAPVLVFLMLIFLGCKGKAVETPTTASKQAQKPKVVSAGPEAVPDIGTKENYSYNPTGRPDPFKPFISEEKSKTALPGVGGSPLQSLEVGQLTLIAVITGGEEPRAMVEDASGKGYILHIGSRVGTQEGVVTRILGDQVVVTEKLKDFSGKTRKRAVKLKLRASGEGEY